MISEVGYHCNQSVDDPEGSAVEDPERSAIALDNSYMALEGRQL